MIGLVFSRAREAITERSIPEPNSGCWLWLKACGATGYGICKSQGINERRAHRLAFVAFRGVIPAGMELDHLCRVRSCVNPYHLEPVSHKQNMERGIHATKKFCKHGHSDWWRYGSGRQRGCRTCIRVREKRRTK